MLCVFLILLANRFHRVLTIKPSYRYHVPRSWLKPEKNLLVLHEELGGDPSKISFSTRSGQTICAHVSELDPPPVDTWKTDKDQTSQEPSLQLNCEQGWTITAVNFASFGTPTGDCGAFIEGSCHWDVLSIVHQVILLAFLHLFLLILVITLENPHILLKVLFIKA